jgi:hypothetical protein
LDSVLEKPVLLLIYRRPDKTRETFAAIRQARPKRLYVSAAGPATEADQPDCDAARAIIDEVDWDCEVRRNFMHENRGCRVNVSRGISWALAQEDEMIILEDDCVATPAFFRFCAELLDRYRDNERVMSISGTNFLFGHQATNHSYFWSRYPNIWGWATWKRAWDFYDADLALWPQTKVDGSLDTIFDQFRPRVYWRMVLDIVAAGKLDAWDFVWFLSCWLRGGLSAQPTVNLVRNIGFDASATHTKKANKLARMPVADLRFPLDHPPDVQRNRKADNLIERQVYSNFANLANLWLYYSAQRLPPGLKNALRGLLGGKTR